MDVVGNGPCAWCRGGRHATCGLLLLGVHVEHRRLQSSWRPVLLLLRHLKFALLPCCRAVGEGIWVAESKGGGRGSNVVVAEEAEALERVLRMLGDAQLDGG